MELESELNRRLKSHDGIGIGIELKAKSPGGIGIGMELNPYGIGIGIAQFQPFLGYAYFIYSLTVVHTWVSGCLDQKMSAM